MMPTPTVIQDHPNTTASVGTGVLGVVLMWILGLFGIHVEPEIAAAITAIVTSVVLFIGNNGVRGVFNRIWRGSRG